MRRAILRRGRARFEIKIFLRDASRQLFERVIDVPTCSFAHVAEFGRSSARWTQALRARRARWRRGDSALPALSSAHPTFARGGEA